MKSSVQVHAQGETVERLIDKMSRVDWAVLQFLVNIALLTDVNSLSRVFQSNFRCSSRGTYQ